MAMQSVLGRSRTGADRLLGVVLLAHLPVALLLGAIYQAWTSALLVGVPLAVGAFALSRARAGATATRFLLGVAFMGFSALFIHQSRGLIELHFHVFASLAFLLAYRDWKVPVVAAAVIAVHHVAFHLMQMAGMGVYLLNHSQHGTLIVAVHAALVVFETAVLVFLARQLEAEAMQTQAVFESLEALGEGRTDVAPTGDGVAAALRTVIGAVEALDVHAAELGRAVEERRAMRRVSDRILQGTFGSVASQMSESAALVETLRVQNDAAQEGTRRFLTALTPVVRAMRDGDLSRSLGHGYGAEYDATASDIIEALGGPQSAISKLKASAQQIDGAAGEIAAGSDALAQVTSEQAATLEEITASLTELVSLSQATAGNVQQAETTTQSASQSAQAVSSLNGTVQQAAANAEESASAAHELAAQAEAQLEQTGRFVVGPMGLARAA